MPRCQPHDLELDSCADCRPRTARPPVPAASGFRPGPYFTAAHPGHCAGCGEDIQPGDEIRADGEGGWERRDCCGMYADEAEAYAAVRSPQPVTGTATVAAFMSQPREYAASFETGAPWRGGAEAEWDESRGY
jgi:hypothetical protein